MSQTRDLRVVKGLYFFYFAAYGIVAVFINVYYHEIGLSGVQIGWINALAPLISMAVGPLLGMLNDRADRPRLLMALAIIGAILAMLGISAIRAFVWLMPLAGVYQLFNNFIPSMIDTTNLAVLGERAEKYGQQRIWGSVGYIASTWIAGQFLEQMGLHWMFYSYSAIMLVLGAATTFMPVRPVHAHSASGWNIRELIGQRAWLFFAASIIPLWLSSNGMYTFLGVYLREMGASQELIGLNSSIGAITEIPAMLFSAFFVQKLGLKRMLIIAYTMYAVRFVLYGLMPAPEWALPIALMHGITFGFFWSSSVMYMNELAPERLRTTAQGMFWALMNLGSVIGAPVSGLIFDTLGPAQLFKIFSGLCVLALVILLLGFRNQIRPLGSSDSML